MAFTYSHCFILEPAQQQVKHLSGIAGSPSDEQMKIDFRLNHLFHDQPPFGNFRARQMLRKTADAEHGTSRARPS